MTFKGWVAKWAECMVEGWGEVGNSESEHNRVVVDMITTRPTDTS